MLEFSDTQGDILVSNAQNSAVKVTMQLSPTGDIQMSTGSNKLIAQLIRALINDTSPLKDLINKKVSTGQITSVVTSIIKRFKNTQLDSVNGQDTSLVGYKLYRKGAGLNDTFVEVSNSIIQWRVDDTGLTNETTYTYGLTKIYNNGSESSFMDQIEIVPSKSISRQQLIIGNAGIFASSDSTVTVFTDYILYFKRAELLNRIIDIDTEQDKQDPRRYSVLVTVEDMKGNNVSIAARRLNPSTLEPI